jgi:hypothetical protein
MLSACVEHKQNRKYGITTTKVNGKTVSIKLHRKAYCEANGLTLDDIRGLIVARVTTQSVSILLTYELAPIRTI